MGFYQLNGNAPAYINEIRRQLDIAGYYWQQAVVPINNIGHHLLAPNYINTSTEDAQIANCLIYQYQRKAPVDDPSLMGYLTPSAIEHERLALLKDLELCNPFNTNDPEPLIRFFHCDPLTIPDKPLSPLARETTSTDFDNIEKNQCSQLPEPKHNLIDAFRVLGLSWLIDSLNSNYAAILNPETYDQPLAIKARLEDMKTQVAQVCDYAAQILEQVQKHIGGLIRYIDDQIDSGQFAIKEQVFSLVDAINKVAYALYRESFPNDAQYMKHHSEDLEQQIVDILDHAQPDHVLNFIAQPWSELRKLAENMQESLACYLSNSLEQWYDQAIKSYQLAIAACGDQTTVEKI